MAEKAEAVIAALDKQLAEAFRDLEDAVITLRGAACVLRIVYNDGGHSVSSDKFRNDPEFNGCHVYVCPEEKDEAFTHALFQVFDQIDKLRAEYYGPLGGLP